MFKRLLTDPNNHDSDNFTYLVHGVMDWGGKGVTQERISEVYKKIKDPNQFYRASLIARLSAESAKQKIGWCGGEICQLGTFGNIGLILDIASDNLVEIAWHSDLGSPDDQKELAKFVDKHRGKIIDLYDLLTETITSYNELILKGHEKTNIVGIFYRGSNSEKEEAEKLRKFVSEQEQKQIPVIELPPLESRELDILKYLEVLEAFLFGSTRRQWAR